MGKNINISYTVLAGRTQKQAKTIHHTKEKTGAFVWALKNLDSLLKIAPFIVETDSISVKYIRTLKTMKGVYLRWLEIIKEFMFAVIHAKVVVEDCISREL